MTAVLLLKWAHLKLSLVPENQRSTHCGSCPYQVWQDPDSSNHSLYLIKLFNSTYLDLSDLLDGSISLWSLPSFTHAYMTKELLRWCERLGTWELAHGLDSVVRVSRRFWKKDFKDQRLWFLVTHGAERVMLATASNLLFAWLVD